MSLQDPLFEERLKINNLNLEDPSELYEEDEDEEDEELYDGYKSPFRDWYEETGHKKSDF